VDVSDPTGRGSVDGAVAPEFLLPPQMPRRDPLIGLRDRPFLLALVLLTAIAAAVGVAVATPTEYRSEADVLVSPVNAESEQLEGLGLLQGDRGSVVAAARLVESKAVSQVVRRRLRIPPSKPVPTDEVHVTPLPQSDLVAIEATTDSPVRAARLANSFAFSLIRERTRAFQIRRRSEAARVQQLIDSFLAAEGAPDRDALEVLRRRLRTLEAFKGADDPTLGVFKRATVPDDPKTRPTLRIATAFLAMLFGGLGLVIILGGITPRVLSELDLPRALPVLARVPRSARRARDARLAPRATAEPFRTLRIRLAAGRSDGRLPRVVVVTSVGVREGKTRTAAHLGLAMAASGARVVLVDGDLARPRLESALGLVPRPTGLSTLLRDEAVAIEPLLVDLGGESPGLRVLPAGAERGHELLDPVGVADMTARLLDHADVVVVAAPVITHYADALALAHGADAVLLSVRLGRTRRSDLARGLDLFRTAGIDASGLVVWLRRWAVRRARRPKDRMARAARRAAEDGERAQAAGRR
jgi:Mrp family chromosome partitioning ATPase